MRLGIIGTGRIAARFMETAVKGLDVEVICVYNPHGQSAENFFRKYGLDMYTDKIDELTEVVDCVYVASPHETHYNYVKMMLESGKHVLCEKPLALSGIEAVELYELASRNNLVLMEAIKTAYCPGFNELVAVAKSGKIGRIIDVEAAFTRLTPTNTREYTTPVYNGSFLEFGSYGLLPVFKLLGLNYNKVSFKSLRSIGGVDTYTKAFIEYNDAMATVKTGLGAKSDGQLLITGTNGYIIAPSPWWLTKKFYVRYEDAGRIEEYNYPFEGSGLQYELGLFLAAILDKKDYTKNQLPSISQNESVAAAQIMNDFLTYNTPLYHLAAQECRKKADQMPMPNIWAHRGLSMQYPENTLSAFEAAAKLSGLTGIELDVQLTKDGEIVVIHDETIDRVTDGSGNVKDFTLNEIKAFKIDAGNGKYTTIPTLQEVLELLKPYCEGNGLLINIELKTSIVRYEGIEQQAYDLVKKFGLEKYIVWSSFLPESVELMKKIDPKAETGMLAASIDDCMRFAKAVCADALHPYIGSLGYKLPKEFQGMPVRAWNMDEPFFQDGSLLKDTHFDRYKLYGATDIITNVPEIYLGEGSCAS